MKKIVEKTISIQEIDDINCNKCGKSTKLLCNSDEYAFYEGTSLQSSFGYGSNKDGLREGFDLCDNCYDNFVQSFVIPPTEMP